jgi:hypothetical protein
MSKSWAHRHTNKKIRRVFKNSEHLVGKVSGRRLNRSFWGAGIGDTDVNPKPLFDQEK